MRPSLALIVFSLLTSGPAAGVVQPGPQSRGTASLGDLARKVKAERTKASSNPAKVFTNDNLPVRPRGEGPTAATGMSATVAEQPGNKTESAPSSTPPQEPASEVHNEKYYRAKQKELQDRMDLHQRQLDVLQQKLSQNQLQYYPDPNKTLTQEYTRADVNKLNDDIQKKKDEIVADQKALDDLQDLLRREGGDPGWLR